MAPLVTVFWLLWRRSVPRSPRWRQSLRPGADPFFVDEGDIDAARSLVAATSDAELFLYPGKEHLFADDSLAAYDQAAATLLTERVLSFLSSIN